MTKVTIIGATGSLGRVLTKVLLKETEVELTLFSRSADRLPDQERIQKIAGSVYDQAALTAAVKGSDVVFVALSGDLPKMAEAICLAMSTTGVKRLIFTSSYGIYGELPGQNGTVQPVLKPYREATDVIEASNLDYTILRPGWFDNSPDISYHLFDKGEVIRGNQISRLAIAQLVKQIVLTPSQYRQANLGIVRD
ncbi:NAD(P)H-binding protein [Streptococcus sp. S784/96/1]|uniref:NAD(P)H-binding protein n=1 Tax=Streptococcus sp. S784/96/1 TaxID=2653499 RepID=UPI00138692AC|nr:NAD(P)H-binding protein [Streptococcus sp. S784/96/1]